MVSLFHCVFMVLLWGPKENFSCNGHHSSSVCKIFHILQSMHLCHCKQKVSEGNPGNGAVSNKTRDNYKQCLAHEHITKCTDIVKLISFVCVDYVEWSQVWVIINLLEHQFASFIHWFSVNQILKWFLDRLKIIIKKKTKH